MKIKPMFRYFFSLILTLICTCSIFGQETTSEQPERQNVPDSITYKEKYGLRLGIDLSKPIRMLLDDDYRGLELVGDYRIYTNYYLAAELGNEKIVFEGDNISTTTDGSYIKIGGDYNAYENWLDMQNSLFVGVRYGFGTFSQTLNDYLIYTSNGYFEPDFREDPIESSGLTAGWIELMAGIKVEVLNNLYLSANVQLKRLISEKKPDGFDNLAIPGFGRTYDGSSFGAGFGYTISYMIPIYKKDRS